MVFAGSLVQLTCSLTYIKEKWDLPLGWSENLVLVRGGERVTGTTKPEGKPRAEVLQGVSREVRTVLFYISRPDP